MGARESNAGHEFHVLWTARRCLATIAPSSDLRVVKPEGVEPTDADDSDERFLGADTTEYFGGETARMASRISICQLKYSVTHPNRAWTVGRLTTSTSKRKNNSVVARMCQAFNGIVDDYPKNRYRECIAKLQVVLVSNQPLAALVRKAISVAQDELRNRPLGASLVSLKTSLEQREYEALQKLKAASGLTSGRFLDFIRVFDLNGFDSESREVHRFKTRQRIDELVIGGQRGSYLELLAKVEAAMQPEAANEPGLRMEDVLAALGATSTQALFPAPSMIQKIDDYIPTGQPDRLAAEVMKNKGNAFIAHGPLGVGKTTTVSRLESALPSGSCVVTYDCFGGGNYLVPGEDRHIPERALVQIANEIAIRLGIDPIVPAGPLPPSDLWREFGRRLGAAANTLNSGAVLTLVIDAADNSVFAAQQQAKQSFIHDLWKIPLPSNVCLVMTCRTNRIGEIEPPRGLEMVELRGFDLPQSTAMLRLRFPEATDEDAIAFHANTNGVPRVQAYALDGASTDLQSTLVQSRETLVGIFEDIVQSALNEVTDPTTARTRIATLFAMQRPASMHTVALIHGASYGAVERMCLGLTPGVQVEEGRCSSTDEDFEGYLRDRISAAEIIAAHSRIADYFLSIHETDVEAAEAVCEHLYGADRLWDVTAFAIEHPKPEVISDGIVQLRIARRRIELGLVAAAAIGDYAAGTKLLFRASIVTRSDKSLVEAVRQYPELAALFADQQEVSHFYLREDSSPWLGPAHARVAELFAWNDNTQEDARLQLRQAHAWIDRWVELDDNKRHDWEFTATDIANVAAATYALDGVDAARDFLSRWGPKAVAAEAVQIFAERVAPNTRPEVMARQLEYSGANLATPALAIAAYWRLRIPVPKAWVKRIAGRLADLDDQHDLFSQNSGWAIALCECAAQAGASRRVLRTLIDRFAVQLPQHAPHRYDSLTDWRTPLRWLTLRAAIEGTLLQVEELLPAALKPSSKPGEYDNKSGDRSDYLDALRILLPAYQIRAAAIIGTATCDDLEAAARNGRALFREKSKYRGSQVGRRYSIWATTMVDAISRGVCGETRRCRKAIGDIIGDTSKVTNPCSHVYVRIAKELRGDERFTTSAIKCIELAKSELEETKTTAHERRDSLLEAARVAQYFDLDLAAQLFNLAVDAAQDIDDDVGLHLGALSRVAAKRHKELGESRRQAIVASLVQSVDAVYPYVSDSEDVLPFRQFVHTVAVLDPPNALPLISRWDDASVVHVNETLPVAAEAFADVGWLRPWQAFGLLHMYRDWFQVVSCGLRIADIQIREEPRSRHLALRYLQEIERWVKRDLDLDDRSSAALRVVEWADENGFGSSAPALSLRTYATTLSAWTESTRSKPSRKWHSNENTALGRVLRRANSSRVEELAKDVALLQKSYAGRRELQQYLEAVLLDLAGGAKHAGITAVEEMIASSSLNLHTLVPAAANALLTFAQANRRSRLGTKSRDVANALISKHFPMFMEVDSVRYGGWQYRPDLDMVATDEEQMHLLLESAAQHLSSLDSHALRGVAERCAEFLSPDDLAGVVQAELSLLAPQDVSPLVEVSRIPADNVAHFAHSMFGHPDTRQRWRAAHMAKAVAIDAGWAEFTDGMVAILTVDDLPGYRRPELPFFSMSATNWALMTLRRISVDKSEFVIPHVDKIAAIATDAVAPHALNREHARRLVMSLARQEPGCIAPATLERVILVNQPLSCYVERKYGGGDTGGRNVSHRSRFHFNSMDTVPYWYEPFARIFGVTTNQVVRMADAWVTDKWGFSNDDHRNDPRRRDSDNDWYLTSNRQGSMPLVESTGMYIEYHALQVVAGELVDGGAPLLVEPYEDVEDGWVRWLDRQMPTGEPLWATSTINSTPIEPWFFGRLPSLDDLSKHPDEWFAKVIGLDDVNASRIVCDGWTSSYNQYSNLRTYVSSALVSPNTAHALATALENTPVHSYRLPNAGEGDGNNGFEDGFRLLGWINDKRAESTDIDGHDPLGSVIATRGFVPDDTFLKMHGLPIDSSDPARLRVNDIARQESWYDCVAPGVRHDPSIASEGSRMWIEMGAVVKYLQERQLDLLIDVRIDFDGKDRAFGDKREESYDKCHIYIVRQDGSIECSHRRRRPRSANIERAQRR